MLRPSNIDYCKSALKPIDPVTAIGGFISGTPDVIGNVNGHLVLAANALQPPTFITGHTIGEVFLPVAPNLYSGGAISLTQYAKVFWRNNSSTDDARNCVTWGANFIDQIPSTGLLFVVSDSILDNAAYTLNIIGFDGPGNPQMASLALNGLSSVSTGSMNFSYVSRHTITDTLTGVLVTANGNIKISSGSGEMGIIPIGYNSGTTEQAIGMDIHQNGIGNNPPFPTESFLYGPQLQPGCQSGADYFYCLADYVTADSGQYYPWGPQGITFSSPRTVATGLVFSDGGTLAKSVDGVNFNAQGVWRALTIPPATLACPDCTGALGFRCSIF